MISSYVNMFVSQDGLIRPFPRTVGKEVISFWRLPNLGGYKPAAARAHPVPAWNWNQGTRKYSLDMEK